MEMENVSDGVTIFYSLVNLETLLSRWLMILGIKGGKTITNFHCPKWIAESMTICFAKTIATNCDLGYIQMHC